MAEMCDFIDRMLAMPPKPKPVLPVYSEEAGAFVPGPAPDPADTEPVPPRVLVHCQRGISRSCSVVIACLMRRTGRSVDDLLAEIKGKRKVRPSANFMEQLRVWGAVGYEIWEDEEKKIPKEAYRRYLEGRAVRLKELGLTGDEPILMQSLFSSGESKIAVEYCPSIIPALQ